ncbi:MAG TPA: hypothetical protein VFQ60_01450 [Patescibacteria group bacterium]|nr:hypothetical protein [Patescibacteria group bacterium]
MNKFSLLLITFIGLLASVPAQAQLSAPEGPFFSSTCAFDAQFHYAQELSYTNQNYAAAERSIESDWTHAKQGLGKNQQALNVAYQDYQNSLRQAWILYQTGLNEAAQTYTQALIVCGS